MEETQAQESVVQDAMPLISVVMPAYNAKRFIAEAIESVLSQSFGDFEFIIVDDGSTDQTREIATSYARRDPRIRVITQSNQGGGAARNHGLQVARGEWVAMMDADDVMLPNRLERQLSFLRANPDVVVASTYIYHINDDGRVIGQNKSKLTDRSVLRKTLEKNSAFAIPHPATIMKKDIVVEVGGYRSQFELCEDSDLWNRVAETGHTVLVQPEFLLKYRIHVNSVCATKVRDQAITRRWMEESLRRRRRGEPEPTWEEFLLIRRKMPWWRLIDENRKDLGKILYKHAVTNLVQRKYHLLYLCLLGAILLSPRPVMTKVWSKYLSPRLERIIAKAKGEPNRADFPNVTP